MMLPVSSLSQYREFFATAPRVFRGWRDLMKILLLDDNAGEMAPRIRTYADSIEFSFAETPGEAEMFLEQGQFDALLLDGHLGYNLSGPDVLRGWKVEGRIPPPVFMVSSDEEMQAAGIRAGAVGALQKIQLLAGKLDVVVDYLRESQ